MRKLSFWPLLEKKPYIMLIAEIFRMIENRFIKFDIQTIAKKPIARVISKSHLSRIEMILPREKKILEQLSMPSFFTEFEIRALFSPAV